MTVALTAWLVILTAADHESIQACANTRYGTDLSIPGVTP